MSARVLGAARTHGFPRDFIIAGRPVNSYKVFLCVGIYLGTLLSAAVGARSGLSPLRVGSGCVACALAGLVGARFYHLAVNFRTYRAAGFKAAWNTELGGWSVFGGLIIVPLLLTRDSVFGIPVAVFWDHMAFGIAFGGAWIRFGCVCNGCCAGRESHAWFARRQHDTQWVYKDRIPVQWLEIAWWLAAVAGLFWLWPMHLPSGSYALAVFGWYGVGRFWLEPLREQPQLVFGRVAINQVVAAVVALAAGSGLLWLMARGS